MRAFHRIFLEQKSRKMGRLKTIVVPLQTLNEDMSHTIRSDNTGAIKSILILKKGVLLKRVFLRRKLSTTQSKILARNYKSRGLSKYPVLPSALNIWLSLIVIKQLSPKVKMTS